MELNKALLISISTLFISLPGFSANKKVCNDLKRTQCTKREDCSWIKKSKKKNGSETKAYCRKKAAKKK